MNTKVISSKIYLLIACLSMTTISFAQNEKTAKSQEVTVNAEVINGVRTTTLAIKSSDGSEQNLQWEGEEIPADIQEVLTSLKIDLDIDDDLEKMENEEKIIERSETINTAKKEEKHVKVIIKDKNGQKTVEWDGEGEMPIELEKELKEIGDLSELEGKKNKIIIRSDRDGEQVFEWTGEEMPDEIRQSLEDAALDDEVDLHLDNKRENRAFLGIAIAQTIEENIENGETTTEHSLSIDQVISGSAAEKAGLMVGDELLAINDVSTASAEQFLELLAPFDPGDEVKISVERAGQKLDVIATLSNPNNAAKIQKKVIIEKEIVENESPTTQRVIKQDGNLELEELKIHPNPTTGKIMLSFKSRPIKTKVTITDLAGKKLFEKRIADFDGTYQEEIDVQMLPKGALILTIEQGRKVLTEKILHE